MYIHIHTYIYIHIHIHIYIIWYYYQKFPKQFYLHVLLPTARSTCSRRSSRPPRRCWCLQWSPFQAADRWWSIPFKGGWMSKKQFPVGYDWHKLRPLSITLPKKKDMILVCRLCICICNGGWWIDMDWWIDVPTTKGICFASKQPNICWNLYPLCSWVMWNIGTFTNPCM